MNTFPISFSSPVVLGVSLLTVISAYVLFGPEPKDRRRRGYPGGLINYGNTCFANAVVQCLAASTVFIRWVEHHLHSNSLAKVLLDLISTINGQTSDSSSQSTVAILINQMRQPRWLNSFEQQDSHEFLLSLINALTTPPTTQPKHVGFAACLDDDGEEDQSTSLMITQSPLITPHPFQGLQATQLQCMECKHKNPINVSLFETLSLMIPERQISNSGLFAARQQRNFTLTELIGNYLKAEMITHVVCSKCQSKANLPHKKVTTFSRLPDVLCLHIIRTTWTNEGWPVKNTSHISFFDQLDMNAFISLSQLLPANIPPTQTIEKTSKAMYRLNSVLVHLGGVSEAGHFIVYRRRVNENGWLSLSDDDVRECSDLEVFTSMAYMLFYERIKN